MNGYVALEIAIGHKLGLFSALKKFNSPVTSHELADSCKLKERIFYFILCVQRHFQQYFSYIMVTIFSGGRSQSNRR
jgi:hypothetical protein